MSSIKASLSSPEEEISLPVKSRPGGNGKGRSSMSSDGKMRQERACPGSSWYSRGEMNGRPQGWAQ